MLDYYILKGHTVKEILGWDDYEKLLHLAIMDKAKQEKKELSDELKNFT